MFVLLSVFFLSLQTVWKWLGFPQRRQFLPFAGHLLLSGTCFPPQYLHGANPGCALSYLFSCFLVAPFCTAFTEVELSWSIVICFNCSCVCSLIRSASNAFVNVHSFCLNNLVRAALSLHPNTNRSLIISSCTFLKSHVSAKRRNLIIVLIYRFIVLLCRFVKQVTLVPSSYKIFRVGSK